MSDGSFSYNLIEKKDLPANGKYKLSENNLIVSKVRPYRGAVSLIKNSPVNHVGSGAFLILNEKNNFKKEVLLVLLRLSVYKEYIMKFNVGSSYPVIKDEDYLNLLIPILDIEIQQKIADLVEESFKLRKQSEQLLEIAKTAVEKAIETDEDQATKYINQQLKELKIEV